MSDLRHWILSDPLTLGVGEEKTINVNEPRKFTSNLMKFSVYAQIVGTFSNGSPIPDPENLVHVQSATLDYNFYMEEHELRDLLKNQIPLPAGLENQAKMLYRKNVLKFSLPDRKFSNQIEDGLVGNLTLKNLSREEVRCVVYLYIEKCKRPPVEWAPKILAEDRAFL